MSVAGILSSAAFSVGAQIFQSRTQKAKTEFQQLGQDLQSGNLSAAQSDFATLQKLQPQSSTTSSSQASSGITQDFNQLSADLKAGNTTAAQQDFTKLQQDFQSQATQGAQGHHHHHHHTSDSSSGSDISQLFSQLGTALQSGNLSAAQQAYSTMLQNFQQVGQLNASPTKSGTTGVSVNA
jgi:outer membrane protein assembly factor BamD (BamD/ComL family)